MKYITHNQWSGDNKFIEFYHRVLNEEWDKIIIFCQNEWEWYNHEPIHWKLLQEHCKSIGRPIHVIVGAAEKDFPVQIDNIVVTYWATAWFSRTYTNAIRSNSTGIFINPLGPAEYTHHYFNFNHRPKSHRCRVIDQLAKHNILKHGKVSIHDSEVYSGYAQEAWRTYNWKHFNFTPLEVDHEKFTVNSHSQMFAVTDVHKKAFCQLVSETTDRSYFISEKTIMPLCAGKPFLVASRQGYHKMLVDLGFVLYDEIFNYSFDDVTDEDIRYEMLVDNYKRLCEIPLSELPFITHKISDKLLHNKNRVREIVYDRNLKPDLVKEILAHYTKTGEEVDHLLCSLHNEEEMLQFYEW
jgi:hypothetical protein